MNLSDIEKNLIQRFVDNEVAREVVRKVLLMGIENQRMIFNKTLTNEQIGANIRACDEGIKFVETAFNEMMQYQSPKEIKVAKNPAR